MTYPSVLSYYANKITNYTSETVQMPALGNNTAGPGKTSSFHLPVNTLVDLRALQLHFHAATGSGSTASNQAQEFVLIPKHVECLIDSITVTCGGIPWSSTPAGTNQFFKAMADWTIGQDRGLQRRVMQGQVMAGMNETANAVTLGAYVDQDYVITNFMGLLGTAKPEVFPTILTNEVRIDIRWAGAEVLAAAGTTTPVNPTYYIGNPNGVVGASDLYMTVRRIDINDNTYYHMLQKQLQDVGHIDIPFQSIVATQGGLGTFNQRLNLPVSSQSVDWAFATLLRSDYAAPGAGVNNRSSKYFQRTGTGLATGQFKINGTAQGLVAGPAQIYTECLSEFNVGQEGFSGCDDWMTTPNIWTNDYFLHPLKLSLPSDEEARTYGGSDSRGIMMNVSYISTGANTNVYPVLWALCKSTLQIGLGKTSKVIE